MLQRWSVREHFVSVASQNVLVRLSSNFTHNTSRIVHVGYMNYDLLFVQNYDLFRRFDGSRKLGLLGRLQSYCTYMISKVSIFVPFQVFGP